MESSLVSLGMSWLMRPYYGIHLSTVVLGLCRIPISGTTEMPRHPHACVQHISIAIKLDNRFAYDCHVDLSSFRRYITLLTETRLTK
jgi:hypothetical protein